MEHIILNEGSDSAALAKVALKALREARSSKTSNSGSIFVSDGKTDDNGISLGTGTIINGVDGGIQPWVGDTTAPGKPTGITAESHNGAVFVSWDGTLEGGIPADFDHVQFTAVDGSKKVDMGRLNAAGTVTAAGLTPGDTVVVTAVAFDDAHDAQGKSKPNASPISDAVPVIVQGAVSAEDMQAIKSDLSKAQSDIAAAEASVTGLTTMVSSVDGKATTSGSAPTASDATGKPEGAMWYVMDASGNIAGTYVLKSGSWVKYAWASSSIADASITDAKIANLDAGKITSGYVDAARIQAGTIDAGKLAANSVTSDKIVAGAVTSDKLVSESVTADKLAANSVTAVKLAAGSVTADKADIGSLSAAIVTSGKFQTAERGARVKMDSSGITGYDANGSTTFNIDATTGDVSMIGKLYSGDQSVSRVIIDDDYNNIDDPTYVDIDGYVAFENPKSNISPFIGGTHGTQTGTSYTGTIMTSGVTNSSKPSASSVQLISLGTDGGNPQGGSEGAIVATMDKNNTGESAAQVHVHSGGDGQIAALIAYDGTDHSYCASVKAYVDSDGNHNVDIVATQIFQVDPITGRVTELTKNGHDLTSRGRCVFNWEDSWSGVSDTGDGHLEGTFNFSMSRGWYLVEAYVRTDGVGKEYHLDMLADRTDGTRMDTWAMNFPMPSRGIGNMTCSQMVYVDDDSVNLAAKLYSRDYGSKPSVLVDDAGKFTLYAPKRPLSRYFRIFAM